MPRLHQNILLSSSWLTRLVFAIAGLCVLGGWLSVQYIKTHLLARSGEALGFAAASAANQLDLMLTERYGDIRMMTQATAFHSRDTRTADKYLRMLQDSYPVYLWLGFADSTGRVIAATDQTTVGVDSHSRTWFQLAKNSGIPHAEDAEPSREAEGVLAVTMSSPIIGTAGEFHGVVSAQIGLPVLEDTVAHIAMALQSQLGTAHRVEWQILNSAGDVVADSVLREEGRINLNQLGLPSALLAQSAPTGFVEERHIRRGIEVVTGYARTRGSDRFSGFGWSVLIRQDREDILLPINRVIWFLSGGVSVVIFPLIGLLVWSTKRLEQEWTGSLRRSEAMQGVVEAARQLTSERNLEKLLQQLIEISRKLTGAQYGALGIFDASGTKLTRFLSSGMDQPTEKAIGQLPTGQGLLGHLAKTEGALRLRDLTQHPASSGVPSHHPVMHSFLGISIEMHGRLFGRLYLTNKETSLEGDAEFTDLDEQVISTLAAQAGAAISNTNLLNELGDAEAQLRLLLESTGEGVCGLDMTGRCVFINSSAANMLGYQRDELLGRNLYEFVYPSYPDGLPYPLDQCPTFRASQTGQARRGDGEVLCRKDGTTFAAEMSAHPILEKGIITGAVVTFRDISERKQAQDALAKAAQDLERKNLELSLARDRALESTRLKSEFLATMSHEIRTPMNGVVGMTDLLLDTTLTEQQREYVRMLRASGENLLGVINDILDFSKIEAGKLDLETIDFDLRSTIESVLELLAKPAHSKNLELVGLVCATAPSAVRGDPGRLRQILNNLIGNAIKFTEQGEVVIQVALIADSNEHVLIRFDVSDTGVGISPEAQSRLFQSFSQADGSTTRKYGGTGLGLAICKRLVEMMGGEIGVDSDSGRGSRFWFTVRLEKQAVCATSPEEPPKELRDLRVCLVDDNATNRTLLQHYATAWGMRSESVDNGSRALEMLRAAASQGEGFALALIDMQMPGMDGLELARAVQAEPTLKSLRLVLITSVGNRGHAKAAQEAGIAGYLTKPIRRSQLRECLELVMRTSGSQTGQATGSTTPLITCHHLAERATRRRTRILVAEDNAVNRVVIVRLLEKLGHLPDVVINGNEAIAALRREGRYDLVFMDCQMPEMDGYGATAEIRKLEGAARRVPIIALTANAMKGDRDKCLEAGMDDYISKPVTVEKLKAILERWIGPTESELI